MNLRIHFAFILFLQVLCSRASPSTRPIQTAARPAWVKEVNLPAPPPAAGKTEDVTDGYLYRLRDFQFNLDSESNYYHFVRKIFSSNGVQNGSEIEVSYDPLYEKLVFHDIRIIRDGKVLDKLDARKFQVIRRESSKESYIYDGSLSALLLLEDVRVNDQIEYSYSIIGNNPIYEGKFSSLFYLGYYDPTDLISIRITAPKERKFYVYSENTSVKPTITIEGNYQVYEWLLTHIPGTSVDNDVPSWYNPYPRTWVSEYQSWNEVADWAVKNYTYTNVSSAGLKKKIEEIRSKGPDNEARLEYALQFVQDEIRYTGLEAGIGGYKPRNPALVFEQRFGDCKDKALLLCYILKELGVEAYPALVNTSARQEIKNRLPSPHTFDHCIVQVLIDGTTYWYDATAGNQGGTYNNRSVSDYGYALVIRPGTQALTKMETSQLNLTRVEETFHVKSLHQPVTLSIITIYRGCEADLQRYYLANSSLKETEKNYLNYTAKSYPQLKLDKPLKVEDDRARNVFTTYETYLIESFFDAPDSTKPGMLECNTYPQTLRDKLFVPGTTIRTSPVALEYPLKYEHKVEMILPEPWNIDNETQEIYGPGIYFKKQVQYSANTIVIDYVYETRKDHITQTECTEFVKKQNQVINQLGYGLTYNKGGVEASSPFRMNWLMVGLGIIFAAISVFVAIRIYKYDPEPTLGYDTEGLAIGGWLILFAIGLCVTPIGYLVNIFQNAYFNANNWDSIISKTSVNYNPVVAGLVVVEVLYNIVMLAFLITLIILFINQRSSVPRLITLYYGISILFSILDLAILSSLDWQTKAEARATSTSLGKLILTGAIWVPYFNLSVRVKQTFVNTLHIPESIQPVYQENE
jgi:transglutaminase-like putative cysteine protease